MDDSQQNAKRPDRPACAVNSTFNNSVGAVAVAAAAAVGLFAWRYFSG